MQQMNHQNQPIRFHFRFRSGVLTRVIRRYHNKNGESLLCEVQNELGELECLVLENEWPLQHLKKLIGLKIQFIPFPDGQGWILPLNNQPPWVLDALIKKLIMSDRSDLLDIPLISEPNNTEESKELLQKRQDLEKLFHQDDDSDGDIEEIPF